MSKINRNNSFQEQLFSWANQKDQKVIITSNPLLAESTYQELEKRHPKVSLFPHTETLPYDFFSPSKHIKNLRMQALSGLLADKTNILIISIQALMSPCPDKAHLLPFELLETNKNIDRKNLISGLQNSGYERKDIVKEVGEFALRGSIIDIYATGYDEPIRIEINESKIESLRTFDPTSQITTQKINSFSAIPPYEYALNQKGINLFKKNWRNCFDTYEEDSDVFKSIAKGKAEEGSEIYLPLFFLGKTSVINYLDKFDTVLLDKNVLKEIKDYELLINERYEEYRYDITRPLLKPSELFLTKNEFKSFLKDREVTNITFKDFNSKKITKAKIKSIQPKKEYNHQIPEIDDRVVHLFHGIGIFKGLKNIKTKSTSNECLEIEYRNNSKVFVPIDSMHLVSKYFGPEEINIDELGSKKWERKKTLAIKKTFDTAAELLKTQAKRNLRKGKKYQIPKNEYFEFCREFQFIETQDQKNTILEIEKDLQDSIPMDRLVCGEVGFGKTEVAMRASFISAFNNSQTCILVPTTVLAQQHYESFLKRFSNSPINIQKLSRDITVRKRKEILSHLKDGHIDIIIGTHALLQGSIEFQRLGLLIIDEEHRFGVRQKEKIKKLKEDVNILYLSATPIPRSLNFALAELKDLSIIATAPENRLSVRTFIYPFNEHLIKESIQRELLRNGQVYYLCNDLRLIQDRKTRIEDLFPSHNVDFIHGKLKGSEIEEKMLLFQNGQINILVCSTIIESGLDIANANTLIVEEADRLGLSQLHQLRGRVGRGKKQAYAYFLKSNRILKRKKADKRLKALKDSDSLSAGFLLSLKDLEARGAGEILGENQSGIMESIGIDLYLRLVNRATNQIQKGEIESFILEKDIEVNLNTSTYIPEDYLPDINQRLIMYNRISSAISLEELKDIQIEMINRFGLFPKELKALFFESELTLIATEKNVNEIKIKKEDIEINFLDSTKDKVFKKGVDFKDNIKKIYEGLNLDKKIV
ncbi:MAG: DEAD/DEAH box helicase [SAR86 cluster bacterium]|nr:DEAD/DEAH box helicase [SAR86 cluster bacterium]